MPSPYCQSCAISGLPIKAGSEVVFMFLSKPVCDESWRQWEVASPPIFLKADKFGGLYRYFGHAFDADAGFATERAMLDSQVGWRIVRDLCVDAHGSRSASWFRDLEFGQAGFKKFVLPGEKRVCRTVFPWVCLRKAWDTLLRALPAQAEAVRAHMRKVATDQTAAALHYDELMAARTATPCGPERDKLFNTAWWSLRDPAASKWLRNELTGEFAIAHEVLSVITEFDSDKRLSAQTLTEVAEVLAQAAFVKYARERYMGREFCPQTNSLAPHGWEQPQVLKLHRALHKLNRSAIDAGAKEAAKARHAARR
jgi:hypothetical protein